MQELAILLSSLAGAASVVAVKRFPRNTRLQSVGVSSHIKNQINSLKIEKDILNKTIARLYEDDSTLLKIQKDRLLLKYQHQLGVILARLEKLELAKRHPDLGPVGDGLITLMDQKLSQLDNRLYELSSKITLSNAGLQKDVKAEKINPIKKMQETIKFERNIKPLDIPTEIPKTRKKPIEITTLTTITDHMAKYPFADEIKTPDLKPVEALDIKPKVMQKEVPLDQPKTDVESKLPTPKVISPPKETPKSESNDVKDDDLEKIKNDILKTLSKLEQAEVE